MIVHLDTYCVLCFISLLLGLANPVKKLVELVSCYKSVCDLELAGMTVDSDIGCVYLISVNMSLQVLGRKVKVSVGGRGLLAKFFNDQGSGHLLR